MARLAIVTATLDPARSKDCRHSWSRLAADPLDIFTVYSGSPEAAPTNGWGPVVEIFGGERHTYYSPEILGVVPAYAIGVQRALEAGVEIIACLHDDLLIEQERWDTVVRHAFTTPVIGLVGFGGGTGLGAHDLYQTPYHPMQLARQDFVSNMRDAESHGRRSDCWERVACLDGFSQIGRAEYWLGMAQDAVGTRDNFAPADNLFARMQSWGVTHHFYDGMLGCFAKRLGWEVWMLPVACHHYGGQTAVGDARYHAWAVAQSGRVPHPNGTHAVGDQAFWVRAHQIGYEQFRDVLPIRLP